jgi:signal transduction histidine kinase
MTDGRRERWWGLGLGLGLAVAALDTASMAALGIRFDMNGRDVSWLVFVYFGSSFALLGFLLGWVREGRRRDRAIAAVLQAQTDAVAAARARLAHHEKLAALGQLAAQVAHEVRNPLAVIRSAAQSIAETLPAVDAEGRRACRFIVEETDRLGSVVASLLGLARPPALAARAVAVPDLVDRALDLARAESSASS